MSDALSSAEPQARTSRGSITDNCFSERLEWALHAMLDQVHQASTAYRPSALICTLSRHQLRTFWNVLALV